MMMTGPRATILTAAVVASLSLTACSQSPSSTEPATASPDTSAESSSTRGASAGPAEGPTQVGLPANAPALVVSRNGRTSPLRSGSANTLTYFSSAYSGPSLPLAWLADPTAEPVVQLPLGKQHKVSPDGTKIVTWIKGSLLTPNRFDVIDIPTGKVIDSVDYTESAEPGDVLWSPDSRSFLFNSGKNAVLHRIGGQTFRTGALHPAKTLHFASDADSTEWIRCNPTIQRYVVTDGEGDGTQSMDGSCVSMGQLVDRAGQ